MNWIEEMQKMLAQTDITEEEKNERIRIGNKLLDEIHHKIFRTSDGQEGVNSRIIVAMALTIVELFEKKTYYVGTCPEGDCIFPTEKEAVDFSEGEKKEDRIGISEENWSPDDEYGWSEKEMTGYEFLSLHEWQGM